MAPFLAQLGSVYRSWKTKRLAWQVAPFIPQLIGAAPRLTEVFPAQRWVIRQAYDSLSHMDVLWVGPRESTFTVILHLPRSDSAASSFERQKKVCEGLRNAETLAALKPLLPVFLHEGWFQGRPYWIEESLPGVNAAQVVQNPQQRLAVIEDAFSVINILHQGTAHLVRVDDIVFARWVRQPIEVIRRSVLVNYHWRSKIFLSQLESRLYQAFWGRQYVVGQIHGDYWPANILVTDDGSHVTGIVDWDLSQPDGLPGLDIANLLISTRRILEKKELGEIITDVLSRGWRTDERALWEKFELMLGGNCPQLQEVLLVFWLHHICANLQKSRYYSMNPVWVYGNFSRVVGGPGCCTEANRSKGKVTY